jgi:hypothetical protein
MRSERLPFQAQRVETLAAVIASNTRTALPA